MPCQMREFLSLHNISPCSVSEWRLARPDCPGLSVEAVEAGPRAGQEAGVTVLRPSDQSEAGIVTSDQSEDSTQAEAGAPGAMPRP